MQLVRMVQSRQAEAFLSAIIIEVLLMQLLLSNQSAWHCMMCVTLPIYVNDKVKLVVPEWAARKPDVSRSKGPPRILTSTSMCPRNTDRSTCRAYAITWQ